MGGPEPRAQYALAALYLFRLHKNALAVKIHTIYVILQGLHYKIWAGSCAQIIYTCNEGDDLEMTRVREND